DDDHAFAHLAVVDRGHGILRLFGQTRHGRAAIRYCTVPGEGGSEKSDMRGGRTRTRVRCGRRLSSRRNGKLCRVGRVFETHRGVSDASWWVSKTRPTLH